ncbi:MAG TPA: peptidylprolyl isomerase [Ignavibacteriaceae bacterium]|nr:peptidylprolyl isomerase [Ignavibacteriaceae bacterium]
MFRRVIIPLIILVSLVLSSCAPKHSDIVVAKFDEEQIKMNEFEKMYEKNAGSYEKAKADSISQLKNFLDLYVNFKMKLRDAKVRGYDTATDLNQELQDYKKKVGVSYILEKQIVDPGEHQLYDRRKYELRVSHIMFRPDSTGETASRQLAQSILDSIKNGASFSEMAKKYSADNYSKFIGGDIYYITAGLLPPSFEDAAYETPVDSVYPSVVQTRYGFHLIKVTDKRERIPQIKASHILVNFNGPDGKPDTAYARAKIDTVMQKLKNGEDFAKLAEQYSDDTGSKKKGGDLGFFSRRMMVKPFDEAAFNLKPGELSDIIESNFGFHIIKLTDQKPYPSFDEDKEELEKIFKQTRYQEEYDSLVDRLKTKYGFSVNQATLNKILENADSVKVGGKIKNYDTLKDQPLFTYNKVDTVYVSTAIDRMNSERQFMNRPIDADVINSAINKVVGDSLLEVAAMHLDETDSDFADLMDDYRNGIYVFKLQDDEVWSKIDADSVKLYNYFQQTKDKYVWPDRINFSEIFCKSDSLIHVYYNQLQNGANFDSLAAKYTERPQLKEKAGNYGLVAVDYSTLASKANELLSTPGSYSEPFPYSGGFSIVKLIAKEPARPKTFEEAKAEVSGAYQEAESKRLEQNYLESLKTRYEPQLYYDKLEEAFKETK